MTKDTNSSELPGQSLFELTAQNLLPEEIALRVLTAVAEELQQLHESGRLHAALSLQTIWWDETTGNVVLAPRNELVFVGGVNADPDSTPFWLKTDHSLSLSNDLTQAQQTLNQSGISERAERIDLYQFAALACRLLSGESVTDYLRSPRIKAKVPVSIQSTIDRALGFQAADRFETATELVHALTGQEQENPSIHSQSDTDLSSLDAGQDTSVFSGGSRESASAQELPFTHLGHYEITGRIGHGGMGDVYKGFEKSLNRQVAIKVLPADFAQQEDFVRRFYAEASAAAKIVHPHIIPIHFIGEDQGCHFFAMQYVEGESLAQLLARRGKLSVDESLDLLAQVLSGLKAAHQHGLIHRDIKPANILLDRVHQRAVIADFGLVKSLQEEQTNTATGVVMGTVDYISPEQGRGQTVDHRSDLYSLGVLLYQLLSGKLPFTAESPTALIFQHVYERPQPLGEINKNVPEALSAVVAKLMAKSPEDRHASARAVLDDLQAIRTGEPLPSRADVALRSDPSAFSRLSDRSGPPQSLVITAPKFDDDPWLPEEIPEETTPSWWQRIKARLGAAAHRHAPELVEHWANTQQQVDLAVAEYQRRQQRLAELVHEADEVLNELRAREAEWRDVSNESQDTAFRTAEELHEAIEAQDNQLASMRLNLAKINATLETLKSQRDILQARLQAARVQKQFGRVTKTPAWKTWLKAATALSLLFIIGMVVSNIRKNLSETTLNSEGERIRKEKLAASTSGFPTKYWNPNTVQIEKIEKKIATSLNAAVMVSSEYQRDDAGKVHAEMKVWDLHAGKSILTLDEPHRPIRMAISENGLRAASAGENLTTHLHEICVWDLSNGKKSNSASCNLPSDDLVSITVSNQDQTVFFAENSRSSVNLGRISLNHFEKSTVSLPVLGDPTAFAIQSHANLAAVVRMRPSSGANSRIEIYNLDTGKMRFPIYRQNSIHMRSLALSQDGSVIAGSLFGAIHAWNVSTGELILEMPDRKSHHEKLLISNGDRFIVGLLNGEVDLVDLRTKNKTPVETRSPVLDIAFAPDDSLILALFDAPFQFIDPETGQEQLLPMKVSN